MSTFDRNDNDDLSPDDQTMISPIENVRDLVVERQPALLMISGASIGRSYTIDKDEYLIGRVDACDLVVEDDLVSRHHCKIILTPQGAEIVDLASTNGTFLNGRRIERSTLKEGDQIQVGSVTIFRFHLQEEVEARFLNDLYDSATKDFLTHTYNKKFFIERIQAEFAHTYRHGGSLSVIVVDIDHFKKVNDTFGHLAGDIALQKVAHHIMSHTRKDDVVARFGGEEFVVLMRDCDLEQARILAENLRQGIASLKISDQTSVFNVTVSAGVATLSETTKTQFVRFESLIQHADTQLYRAKESGRNRVCA